MLKSQITATFMRIYHTLPLALQRGLWGLLALTTLVTLTEFALAGAVSLLGIALASPQTIMQSPIMQQLVAWLPVLRPTLSDSRLLLGLLLCLLCATTLLKTAMLAFLTWRQSYYSQRICMDMGVRLFKGFMRAPYLWHTSQKISELTTVLGWRSKIGLFLFCSLQALSQLVVVLTLLATVFCMAPLAGILILGVTGTSAAVVFRCSRRWISRYSQQCAQAQQVSMKFIHIGLNGIRDILICQQHENFIRQYAASEKRYMEGQSVLPVFPPMPSWVLEFVGVVLLLCTVIILYWQGASMAHVGAMLTLLAAVAWRILPVMNRALRSLFTMQQQLAMTEGVLQKLREVEQFSRPGTASLPCPLQRELRMDQVSFRYPSTPASHHDVLQKINICISRGSMIGIIGPSGAGKSTLVNLLTGLYPPTQGKILVDGNIIDDARRSGWMQSIGYVPQDPFLLNGSIGENIAFRQWGATIDRQRVLECCHMAAMNFLEDLEEGIDTVIGERGVRLSGGQLQRVSIARALYNRPQLMIFDEATSALDGASEQAILQTINALRCQMTVIMIAHRLSTVKGCDYVYWVDKGTIHREGSVADVLPAYEASLKMSIRTMASPNMPSPSQGGQ